MIRIQRIFLVITVSCIPACGSILMNPHQRTVAGSGRLPFNFKRGAPQSLLAKKKDQPEPDSDFADDNLHQKSRKSEMKNDPEGANQIERTHRRGVTAKLGNADHLQDSALGGSGNPAGWVVKINGTESSGKTMLGLLESRKNVGHNVEIKAASQRTYGRGILQDDDVHSQYSPVVARIPNRKDLERALKEFARLGKHQEEKGVHENERHVEVVLATGINLHKWTNGVLYKTINNVRFEALIEDGVTLNDINDTTKCDVIIVGILERPHQFGVSEINRVIGNYGVDQCNSVFISGGGSELFTIDSSGNTSNREPDVTLTSRISRNAPTIIVEFEHEHRSVQMLDLWCREYFYTSGVRQVIGIIMFNPNPNGKVAALAIQYGYNKTGQVDVQDTVSFGHRNVSRQYIPDAIWKPIRNLPNPTLAQTRANENPWTEEDKGFLRVPFGECTFNSTIPLPVERDLQLDLFGILCNFCGGLN